MRLSFSSRTLLYADHAQNRPTRAQLHVRADSYLNGCADPGSVHECAKARVRIHDVATPIAETKLSVLARNHRPLILRKEIMADGRIAPHQNHLVGEGALSEQLAAAIFCENNLHEYSDKAKAISTCS